VKEGGCVNREKLRYSILREISNGNTELTEETFGVDENVFDNAIRFLDRENYLIGVFYADDRPQLHTIRPELTEKGEQYLKEKSNWSKAYKTLREFKDWIG